VRRSEDDAKAAAIGLKARRSPSAWLRAAFPIVANWKIIAQSGSRKTLRPA